MLSQFKKHIESSFSFLADAKLLVTVSGGIDSVVLAHLCSKLGLNYAIAHCNFGLRNGESDEDEDFVISLAEDLNVEVFIENFDTQDYADTHKLSIQMAARELRYNWFQELANHLKFDYILTAHNADDNLETFLINFTRGTGLNGLTGIPAINDNVARPLLNFSRAHITAFAEKERIKWREDSSNSTTKYLRNKLRHEVIPVLKEINPQLLDSLKNTLTNLQDTADIVEESLNAVAKRAIVSIDENGVSYKISEFKKVNNPKAYLFEMFKSYGFKEWDDVLALLDAQSGKQVLSVTHRLVKHRNVLILSKINNSNNKPVTINDLNKNINTPIGKLCFEDLDKIEATSKEIICVDKDKLKLPLMIRPWMYGDFFYPHGMTGKKKISKYLKDEKLSLIEKENVWVLTSQEDIVWIVGRRADDRFKVSEKTTNILKIHIS
ncbi:MAG: tRNA lysidine(34) synthetase TilS [Winogradskyella sp.]|nr:tRNA lysidine(34) synthetase TilS [Winogradskyella sp.]